MVWLEGEMLRLARSIIVPWRVPVMLLDVALMVAAPAETEVTKPVFDTVATALLDEDQVAVEEMSEVLASESVAVAVSCWLAPTFKLPEKLLRDIEDKVGDGLGS